MVLGCLWHALLLATASSPELPNVNDRTALQRGVAEAQGHTATPSPRRQHAAPPQPAAAALADASKLAGGSSPASLPLDILESAKRGELLTVTTWLRKGGAIDSMCATTTADGQAASVALLHTAARYGQEELVRELLKRGASIDLQSSLGITSLMNAAAFGHLPILLLLLQHSADPDLQSSSGLTALMMAATLGNEACVQALLGAKANTELIDNDGDTALQWAEITGHTATAQLLRQHATPPQPAAAAPAATPDADEPAVSSPAALPLEIFESALLGNVQKVVKWLRKGGAVDALRLVPSVDGSPTTTASLLHIAAMNGHLDMVRELLKRGASVDLPNSFGSTALSTAAEIGHSSTLLLLLQHSANPDLQNGGGHTALMRAATSGHEACVQALLQAGANTELLDLFGHTALQLAETEGRTSTAALLRQHAGCLAFGLSAALCAALPSPCWPWLPLSLVFGAIVVVAEFRVTRRTTLAARPDQDHAAWQRRPHRHARHATRHTRAEGQTSTKDPSRQHTAPPQLATVVASHTLRAEQGARARVDGAVEEQPQVEEEAEHQTRSKKSKKKSKACRAAASANKPSEAHPPTATTPPPAAAPEPAASAAEQAEAALRAAIAGDGLSALEAALAAAPRKVREGGVGAEARARRDRLLEAQQEAEREAEQEAAAEAARLAAAEAARLAAAERAQEAARVAAAAEAREEAVALAAALAVARAKADALERATAGAGDGGGSGAAGLSAASEAAVPDQLVCPITAEIMTDPVNTADGHTYERSAIEQWLETHNTSPTTGLELDNKQLIPCHSLRSLIQEIHERDRRGAAPDAYGVTLTRAAQTGT